MYNIGKKFINRYSCKVLLFDVVQWRFCSVPFCPVVVLTSGSFSIQVVVYVFLLCPSLLPLGLCGEVPLQRSGQKSMSNLPGVCEECW